MFFGPSPLMETVIPVASTAFFPHYLLPSNPGMTFDVTRTYHLSLFTLVVLAFSFFFPSFL